MSLLIQLENIVKNYRSTRALDGVNLEVRTGVTGLLGPNGAGKSTLIKVILGLVKITSGSGTVLGHRMRKESRAIRDKIGYMTEDDCYIPGMTGIEVVQFAACLSGLPSVEGLRRAHEILDFCGMKQERYRNIETFSTGMRQKVKFAAAIVHDPEFLILDEPTSGLDPEEREALLYRIKILCTQMGKSAIISTHILPDVQAICDQVVILANGQIRLDDKLESLNATVAPTVTLVASGNLDGFSEGLSSAGFTVSRPANQTLRVESSTHDGFLNSVWKVASQHDVIVHSLTPAKTSLEEIFMQTIQEATHANS
jgi:ABC-2 type transport system ATP-binding protein